MTSIDLGRNVVLLKGRRRRKHFFLYAHLPKLFFPLLVKFFSLTLCMRKALLRAVYVYCTEKKERKNRRELCVEEEEKTCPHWLGDIRCAITHSEREDYVEEKKGGKMFSLCGECTITEFKGILFAFIEPAVKCNRLIKNLTMIAFN